MKAFLAAAYANGAECVLVYIKPSLTGDEKD